MLAEQGVISSDDALAIDEGLAEIKASIDAGDFEFDINNEDIHMSVESVLTEKIGDAGARLHTGRSRNDQVATDTRLFCKKRCRPTSRCVTLLSSRQRLISMLSCRVIRTFSMLSRCSSPIICSLTFGC